jgi:hypothetical protein
VKPPSNPLFISNPNIGVIDTEVFFGKDNTYKIYALGFKTLFDKESNIYYINEENLDSDKVVLSMLDGLLRPKYSDIIFYTHNLSNYDVVFILKVLHNYNEVNDNNKYIINCVLRKHKIIKINNT